MMLRKVFKNIQRRGLFQERPERTSDLLENANKRQVVKRELTEKFQKQLNDMERELSSLPIGLRQTDVLYSFFPRSRWDFKEQTTQGWPNANQATRFQGKVVRGTYYGNAAFGYLSQKMGDSLPETMANGDYFSRLNRLGQSDQEIDMEEIISGWCLAKYGNPWLLGVPYYKHFGNQK